MAKFERSREGRRDNSSRGPRRDSGNRVFKRESSGGRNFSRGSGRDFSRGSGRDFGRNTKRNNDNRRDFQKTKVTCSSCGSRCEVPFKPTSSKPVYCDNCFTNKGRGNSNSNKHSEKDFDVINEKLNKIMKALEIK